MAAGGLQQAETNGGEMKCKVVERSEALKCNVAEMSKAFCSTEQAAVTMTTELHDV